jgi:hypothetical protein
MLDPQFLCESIAAAHSGLSTNGWKRFLTASGLTVYRLPGNGRVVDRAELEAAIIKVREALPLDEAISRD